MKSGVKGSRCARSAIAAFAIATLPANSADTPEVYSAYFADVPLGVALSVIGRDLGMEFTTENIGRQRVRDLELSGPPQDVIDGLMKETGMEAFAFNGQVFVAPTESREVRLVRLGNLKADRALAALDEAGLIIPGFDITEVAGGQAIVLSGPVKYLAISESVIASIDTTPDTVDTSVRVRRAGKLETVGGASLSEEPAVD